MVPAMVPVAAMGPPTEEPAPLSSSTCASPIPSHSPWHLGLIPSTMVESAPTVHGARPVANPVFEAVDVVATVVPTTTEAPISMPILPSLMDL